MGNKFRELLVSVDMSINFESPFQFCAVLTWHILTAISSLGGLKRGLREATVVLVIASNRRGWKKEKRGDKNRGGFDKGRSSELPFLHLIVWCTLFKRSLLFFSQLSLLYCSYHRHHPRLSQIAEDAKKVSCVMSFVRSEWVDLIAPAFIKPWPQDTLPRSQ